MTADMEITLKSAIAHMSRYGAKPQRVINKRQALTMNRADHELGVERPRHWAMGDQFVVVCLPDGPRVVMFV